MSKLTDSSADYQLAGDSNANNAADASSNVVASFLVYGAWGYPEWLSWQPNEEPRLGRGVQLQRGSKDNYGDLSHVLIAGAVFASCQEGLDKFKSYDWRHYLYLVGSVLMIGGFFVPNHFLLAKYVDELIFPNVGDWAIGVALGLFLWLVAWIIHGWAVWGLESNITKAMEDLNFPFFQMAGYRVSYQIEATGPAYTLEHRIYVLSRGDKSKEHLTLLDVLPDSTRPIFVGQKTVYLHTASFWGTHAKIDETSPTQANRDYLHQDEQPAMLNSIHPLLWGALHQAFWVDEIEQLKNQRRVRTTDALLVLFLACLWLLPTLAADQANVTNYYFAKGTMMRSWLLAVAITGALVAFYWAFLQVLMNRTAATVGNAHWTRAAQLMGPVLAKYYWRLDYRAPGGSSSTNSDLQVASSTVQDGAAGNNGDQTGLGGGNTPGPSEYCLAFIPYVPRITYQASPHSP